MKITPEDWKRVEPLLARALELDPAARAGWLSSLAASHPAEAPLLARLLATHERAERAREMETVPRLAPFPPAGDLFRAGETIGPFRLVRLLGRGGMGEVWLAEQADGRLDRQVALKLPALQGRGEVWRERFRRERDILARLEHPHIARLYDAGVAETGQPWLALEFVEGESLVAHAQSKGLPQAARLALFRQVLAAVAHAHRHLVVHRDIKPANILVDGAGQVKLLDFGIAKLVDAEGTAVPGEDLTRLGGRVMTIRYAAPEQVAAGAITTATDIYSLGVVLHELLAGASPYRAVREGLALTDAMLVTEEASALAPVAISGDLDAIVRKAMRRDPAARYASAAQFDEDVVRHLERRPVKARAGTWRYLAGRFAQRHKLPLAMAAAVLLTTAAGLAMVERERRVAVAERERAERHFASVRKLANTFIFEVHDELETLPGALKARGLLVKTSLDYLDALAAEPGGDPRLMAELASAYRKIGNVQGQPGGANTGDLRAAVANFEKGKRLFAEVDRLLPGDIAVLREHASLSYALARARVLLGDPRWEAEIAGTVRLSERVAALPGATPRDRARVAGAMAEQANLSSIMHGQGPAVEAMVEKAVAILEALARESPQDTGVRTNLASTYERAAIIFTGDKRTPRSIAQGVAFYRKAVETLRALAVELPRDNRMPKLLAQNLVGLANSLVLAGEPREADRLIGEAVAIAARLAAADPGNAEAATDQLSVLGQAAVVAYRAGDPPRAIGHARAALAVAARLPEDTRRTRDVRNDVAETQASLARALVARAEARRRPTAARLADLREAKGLFAEALAFLDAVRAEKLGAIPEEEERELRDDLRRCEAALARLPS